jgi:hypothetical protein
MLPAVCFVLVLLGSVSFALLVSALLQSSSTGSVDLVLLGLHIGPLSFEAAIVLSAVAGFGTGLATVGLVLLRRRGRARAERSAADRARLDETEVAARTRLLEYRIQLLAEQAARLSELKESLSDGDGRVPMVSAGVEPKLVPGRPPASRPLKKRSHAEAPERARLVLLPEPEELTAAEGPGSG